ncbi:MAG: potassium channel protein [Deltaproteobacteria bacterium]|nr:potassium channel protein [Deltaproteobacteria bacterium]MBW2158248.1 potassium channel protein [Deltaproteobacteria bacterium]MBW2197810.1 potassium channel protein [Deltaproteobacteria bacterium]MBW2228613.1 potassium channel protein [Deltaproteobacteria bacterium]MBW2325656.1 potassium channel protein [Deltaproteobacteria bacterium]
MDRTKQFILHFFLFACLLIFGAVGYIVIEGWSFMDALYMTVITLATVGYGEVHEISPEGRLFTVILIFLGVGFFLYVVGNVIQFLVEGRIRHILGRRILDKQISKLKNHFIVCGYGRVGRALCSYLIQKYIDVVVIEQNPNRVSAMDEDGILYTMGGATDEAILMKAGIKRARGIISVLGSDADNVFLVLIAKRLNPKIFVVARANQNETEQTLYSAGADKVVSPFALGARRIAHAILRPNVIHFLELAFADDDTDINVEEIPVNVSSKLVNVSLQESGLRKNFDLIILSIRKTDGAMCFNPKASDRFEAGDTVIAVGSGKNLMQAEKILNP